MPAQDRLGERVVVLFADTRAASPADADQLSGSDQGVVGEDQPEHRTELENSWHSRWQASRPDPSPGRARSVATTKRR